MPIKKVKVTPFDPESRDETAIARALKSKRYFYENMLFDQQNN